jgi:RND family efflux transporter MFP subunit
MTRTWATWIAGGAILASAACDKPALEEAQTTAAVPVTVEAARIETLRGVITVSGTVTPAPGADWVITAPEAASIAELPKAEGDAVAVGDLLVRFDIPTLASDVAAKRAAVAQATARLDLAKAAVARLSGLVTQGVAARREVEEAKREQLDAEADLAQAQSAAEASQSLAKRAVVRATFPGVVAKRWHNVGDLVEATASDPVLRVIDPQHLQVVASVPVGDLVRVQHGRAARIIGPAGGEGDAAVVVARSAQVDTGSATGDVRLAFAKPTSLPAGAAVEVAILAEERKDVLVVPAAAIVRDAEKIFVFVAGADNKAHRREVALGLVTRDLVEVRSGIAKGDQIITQGHDGLPDGGAISIAK